MDNAVSPSAGQALPPPAGAAWQSEEASRLAGPVCFGRHRQSTTQDGIGVRLRLRAVHADALAELLPILLCGEESAALAMDRIGSSVRGEREMRDALARIARDEMEHQTLLQRTRAVLPQPPHDPELSAAMRRFFMQLASRDPATHCARIAAVDAAVCLLLAALRNRRGPIAMEPTLNAVVGRIHRDEARHVAVTSRYATELAGSQDVTEVAVEARFRLSRLLERRAVAMEGLGVDPDQLFQRLRAVPLALRS
jgi:hypothetical protein